MNWFTKLFPGRSEWQDKCTCAQHKMCPTVKNIQGAGQIGVDSKTLLHCDKVKLDLARANRRA